MEQLNRTLILTIKKKWFDMIASGEKTEEYREIKKYWTKRLIGKEFDTVTFRNGYKSDSPTVVVELIDIDVDDGNIDWGAEYGELYYVLKLGKIR